MAITYQDSLEFVHSGCGQKIKFDIYWHDTLKSLQNLAYTTDNEGEAPSLEERFPRKESDALVESTNCWGFAYHARRQIHVWVSENASATNALATIAHEVGHTIPPFHRSCDREEMKAAKCEGAAFGAMRALRAFQSWKNMADPFQNGQAG